MSQLSVFSDNLFSKKSQIGMQITSLEVRGHKKALAERAGWVNLWYGLFHQTQMAFPFALVRFVSLEAFETVATCVACYRITEIM